MFLRAFPLWKALVLQMVGFESLYLVIHPQLTRSTTTDIRTRTSGAASPQLIFDGYVEVLPLHSSAFLTIL